MATPQQQSNHHVHEYEQLQSQSHAQSCLLLDALYCEEEKWGEVEFEEERDFSSDISSSFCYHHNRNENAGKSQSFFPLLLLEQDLFWEDEELLCLFTKERETHAGFYSSDCSFNLAREEAVEWILKVNAHYGFSALTAILAINYFDRFLSSLQYQKDKPWMIQLSAVTCLSLAAKVEEIQVPILLDFQVENAKFVFEAKTIQKMELLVLSTLKWRMNPVTPLSFLDHIIRRLGLKNHLHWEFFRRCETLLLSVMTDSRLVRYLPSVLATSSMLHVIHQVEPCNATEYQNQLLGVLKISKEKVNDCCELISELSSTTSHGESKKNPPHKRKHDDDNGGYGVVPCSPSGIIDAVFSSDSSNESWVSSSVSFSPGLQESLLKRRRAFQEQQMRLPSLSRVFVDAVGSPR